MRYIFLLAFCGSFVGSAGCWAPNSGVKQAGLKVTTDWLGKPVIEVSSDASMEAINLRGDKKTGTIGADRITVNSNATGVNQTLPQIIVAETGYAKGQWDGSIGWLAEANKSPLAIAGGDAIRQFFPTLGQYIQTRGATQIAKTQSRGQIIREFAGLAAMWKSGTGSVNPQQIIDNNLLPNDIINEAAKLYPQAFGAPPATAVTPKVTANKPPATTTAEAEHEDNL